MMPAISCPYCNASVSTGDLHRAGTKVPCPRCGEPFPGHLVKGLVIVPTPEPVATPTSPGWTNRKIGLAIVGAMFLLAVLGLAFALATMESRHKNNYRVKRDMAPAPSVHSPMDLRGLGFLPAEVNVVLAVQVAELFKDPAGTTLLQAPRPAIMDLLLGTIEKWTKLKAEDLDHIVLGTEIKDKFPQLTVVVETRRPYDPAALAKALHPAVPIAQRGRPLFRFGLQPGEGMLWCPQPRTLVLLFRLDGLKMDDLEAIPLSPRQGTEAPPKAIQDILAPPARVNKNSLIWIAGRLPEPSPVKELLTFANVPADYVHFLTSLRDFGVSLVSQEGLVLIGHFQTGAEKTTAAIRKQLEGLNSENLKSRVVADPEARWITWQMGGPAQAFRDVVGQLGTGK
ncbi:MAG TPA: hypothetical protein VNX28_03500 [Gemmataceae bacterium]|jgi:hypothetical protein|nr:hypothetical protein [Gemmataceae bacterium]